MNIVDIIIKKREGGTLSEEEIQYFIDGYTKGSVEDYQASALLMAIFLKGMDRQETAKLTMAMARSGDMLSFGLDKPVVDKHSSGGVGDKTTLVLAPVVSACGLPIAKLSGRGLGFSGGTIDKLESIPGFRTELTHEEAMQFVKRDGIVLMGQSGDIAPADKKLYALRDVTGTVDSIPLIASSIMSKKLADGSDAIVLDVKCGSGAFMKTVDDAIKLATEMVHIGENNGKKTIALVTNMDQPLGVAVGNALEAKEAIETLRGGGPRDFVVECEELAANMLLAGDLTDNFDDALHRVREVIENGKAFEKFETMVKNQGGDLSVVEDPSKFAQAKIVREGKAEKAGYVTAIDTEEIGKASVVLGAGRVKKSDTIDPAVGLMVYKKCGDKVEVGDVLFAVHANDPAKGSEALDMAQAAYTIATDQPDVPHSPIIATVRKDGVTWANEMEASR